MPLTESRVELSAHVCFAAMKYPSTASRHFPKRRSA